MPQRPQQRHQREQLAHVEPVQVGRAQPQARDHEQRVEPVLEHVGGVQQERRGEHREDQDQEGRPPVGADEQREPVHDDAEHAGEQGHQGRAGERGRAAADVDDEREEVARHGDGVQGRDAVGGDEPHAVLAPQLHDAQRRALVGRAVADAEAETARHGIAHDQDMEQQPQAEGRKQHGQRPPGDVLLETPADEQDEGQPCGGDEDPLHLRSPPVCLQAARVGAGACQNRAGGNAARRMAREYGGHGIRGAGAVAPPARSQADGRPPRPGAMAGRAEPTIRGHLSGRS